LAAGGVPVITTPQKKLTRIYIRDIPECLKVQDFMQLFKAIGDVKAIEIERRPNSEILKEQGFIKFKSSEDAKKAILYLNVLI